MTRGRAAIASSMVSTMAPVMPSSTISGTEPQRKASTGVPQAMASIMDEPERLRPVDGKQQRLRVAQELRLLLIVDLADEFNARAREQRFDLRPEIDLVGAVHLGGDLERNAERARAMMMARSGRFSGEMRPRKAR